MKKAITNLGTKFSMLFMVLLVFTLLPVFSVFGATTTPPNITWKEVSPFHEKATDNGTVSGAYDITLTGGKFQPVITDSMIHATSLPAGLTAKVSRTSATAIHLTLAGAAIAHDQENTVTHVQFHVQNEAFLKPIPAATHTTLANVKVTFVGVTKFNVTGTVKDKATSKGLAATVQLKDSTGKLVGTAVKATATGTYSIPAVHVGKGYTIVATFAGYKPVTSSAFEVKHATTVPLVMDEILYTMKGVVKTNAKLGLAGAKVQLFDAAGKAVGTAITTKANGTYEITSVKPATYTVHATLKGYKTFVSAPFEVKADLTKDCVLVKEVVKQTYVIKGKITGSNKPTGLAAKIQLKDAKSKKIVAVITANAKGDFQIKSVASGEYMLSVSMKGYTPVNTAKFKIAKKHYS